MNPFKIFYVSQPATPMTAAQVRQIVGASQVANRRIDVTGVLAYSGRHFAQVLEGREADVRALAARIKADPRHHRFRLVSETHDEPLRDFNDWAMQLVESPALDADIAALVDGAASDGVGVDALDRIRKAARWASVMDVVGTAASGQL